MWKIPENVSYLIEAWKRGDTASMIANVLGCSRNAAIGKAHRLGLAAESPRPARTGPSKAKPPKPAPSFWPKLPHPEPAAEPQKWSGNPVSLLEAKYGQCRQIIDPKGSPEGLAMVCGAPVEAGHVYQFCAHHMAINTIPNRSRGEFFQVRSWRAS